MLGNIVYRHKVRGTQYEIVAHGKLQASCLYEQGYNDVWQTHTYKPLDMVEVVIYRSVLDQTEVWVRPILEFYDGRFELVN